MMNRFISGPTIGLVATVSLFIGYCIYFDKKRSDPNYKKKILEGRKRQLEEEERIRNFTPDLSDPIVRHQYFIQELEAGEESLRMGDTSECVEHFCKAIVACPQPEQMLATLQQTIPQQTFYEILRRLPEIAQRSERPKEPPRIRLHNARAFQMDDTFELE